MTYEELRKANEECKHTLVKDRPYIEVNERIKAFRKVFPMGFIRSEMLSNENGVCVFHAECGIGETILGVGHAYEKETSSFINKTSYIENCETSAVGRALGMAGFGIDTSIASAEEVQNAINNQEQKPETKPKAEQKPSGRTATPKQLEVIRAAYDTKEKMDELLAWLKKKGFENLESMSIEIASTIIKKVKGGK